MNDVTPLQSGIRLLVVEDSDVNRDVLEAMLDVLGYENTEFATSGLAAVKAFEVQPFDIVLMDCQMPKMDGYEATCRIRAIEEAGAGKHPPSVIIAITGDASIKNRDLCCKTGMNDILAKPFTMAEIKMMLERWLS
jgi:CheY-like chemotaxis protein